MARIFSTGRDEHCMVDSLKNRFYSSGALAASSLGGVTRRPPLDARRFKNNLHETLQKKVKDETKNKNFIIQ